MSESVVERISRLLTEGLELFGEDHLEQAALRWREVLRLDPGHREARDYLESAGFTVAHDADSASRTLVAQALLQAGEGEAEEALPLLRSAVEASPDDLELQATLELVRGHLYAHYQQRTRQGAGRPRVRVGSEQLLRFNLPPDAGFVLSLVDGHTRVDELVTVTGMDPFDALHLLGRLESAGIIEMDA